MDTIALMQQLLPHLQNQRLPTAAVAETPSNLMAFVSGTGEAALPPEAASTSATPSAPVASSTNPNFANANPTFANYMAAVQAAAVLQSDAFHSAFRTPFPQSSPSSSQNSSATSSDSFLTLALSTLVSPGDSSPENSRDDSNSRSTSSESTRTGLLCQVCSDTASGFHYGVFACEGCKGFFRRSIQQKINYRPCSKSQQCAIVRNNRNRCQYCRLKKCISVGMSRDAVRFGRVPKREKVKMVEEMQKATARSLMDSMMVELEDEQALSTAVDWGFQEFGETLKTEINSGNVSKKCGISVNEKMEFLLKNFSAVVNGGHGTFTKECPVKSVAYLGLIKAVVTFSESVRGFMLLFQKDRVRLLKNSIFQVLLLRLISLKSDSGEYLFNTNIQRFPDTGAKLNSSLVAEFVERFRSLKLDSRQTALFTALVMCQSEINCNSAASFELSQANLVKVLQDKLWMALQKTVIGANAIDMTILIQNLFSILGDLKKLHELHEQRLKEVAFNGQLPVIAKKETVIEGMPALRRALESPIVKAPSSTSSIGKIENPSPPKQSVRDRHPTVSSLLSAKPVVVQNPSSPEDEQPLNLCVKDKVSSS
ncbi:hypothetical protein FO519_006464 [Halicephalobus sp. NKZ332]|nr:hypothetical protein FO519_006464 [Halicephalobus sp. NKZ332]